MVTGKSLTAIQEMCNALGITRANVRRVTVLFHRDGMIELAKELLAKNKGQAFRR